MFSTYLKKQARLNCCYAHYLKKTKFTKRKDTCPARSLKILKVMQILYGSSIYHLYSPNNIMKMIRMKLTYLVLFCAPLVSKKLIYPCMVTFTFQT